MATVDELIASVAEPLLVAAGFRSTKARRWVRSFAPVRHVFEVVAMKGASYIPVWGISLDFVPHLSGKQLAWHRTEKSARADLVYDPVDFDARWRERWSIEALGGEAETLHNARRVLPSAIRSACEWLGDASDVAVVLKRAEWLRAAERSGRRFGFENYVQQPLAYAFLLARNGNVDAARERLNAWISSHQLDALRDELTGLLMACRYVG